MERPKSALAAPNDSSGVDLNRIAAIRSIFKGLNNFEKRAKLVAIRRQGRQRIEEATEDVG